LGDRLIVATEDDRRELKEEKDLVAVGDCCCFVNVNMCVFGCILDTLIAREVAIGRGCKEKASANDAAPKRKNSRDSPGIMAAHIRIMKPVAIFE